MPLPRMTTRRWMIAVAAAAITGWWVMMTRGLTPYLIAPVGPLIGVAYYRSRERRRTLSYLFASILGGAIEAVLLLTLSPLLLAPVDPNFPIWYTAAARDGILLIFVGLPCLSVGVLIGVAAWAGSVLAHFVKRLSNPTRPDATP